MVSRYPLRVKVNACTLDQAGANVLDDAAEVAIDVGVQGCGDAGFHVSGADRGRSKSGRDGNRVSTGSTAHSGCLSAAPRQLTDSAAKLGLAHHVVRVKRLDFKEESKDVGRESVGLGQFLA